MKIVVVHESFEKDALGGGELVALEIARTLNVPIYTLFNTGFYPDDVEIIPFKQHDFTKSKMRFLYKNMRTFFGSLFYEDLDLDDCDLIISSGHIAKSIIPMPDTVHIHYCHAPPRFAWDLSHKRGKQGIIGRFYNHYCRILDQMASERVDHFIANSDITQKRIKRFYNRDSKVIYPPIDTSKFKNKPSEDFFLTVGRISEEKRTELIIKAFNETGHRLKIAGSGDKRFVNRLKKMAKKNIEFLGYVSEGEKIDLLSRCTGFVFLAKEEDFGMTPIEAHASGKPVIGVKEGFTSCQIKEGVNGLFVDEPSALGLVKALKEFKLCDWNSEEIQNTSEKYDQKKFRSRIIEVIDGIDVK